jgi:Rrf2 family protein
MKIPAKVVYATKAVIELGLRHNGSQPVTLNAIVKAQNIPPEFLVQLLLRLKSAGMVNSARGLEGGYFLTRHPSQISLADIVRAIDDSIIDKHADKTSYPAWIKHIDGILADIWLDINEEISRRLEQVTIDQLIAKLKDEQLTYQI